MNERLIHLRIKIKSLAAEASIIRKEASKTKGMTKWGLNHHKTAVVRYHARHNLLAYGLLRQVPYEVMEKKCDIPPDFKMVADIAKRFGMTDDREIVAWVDHAKAYLKEQSK